MPDLVRYALGFVRLMLDLVRYVLGLARYVLGFARYVLDLARYVLGFARYVLDLARYVLGCVRYILDLVRYALGFARYILDLVRCVLDLVRCVPGFARSGTPTTTSLTLECQVTFPKIPARGIPFGLFFTPASRQDQQYSRFYFRHTRPRQQRQTQPLWPHTNLMELAEDRPPRMSAFPTGSSLPQRMSSIQR